MKIIDLLNKISNGEEVPNKIMYEGQICHYKNYVQDYIIDEENKFLFSKRMMCGRTLDFLNSVIEILDEPKKDKIEKLEKVEDFKFVRLIDKINKLIDEVNKLKEE